MIRQSRRRPNKFVALLAASAIVSSGVSSFAAERSHGATPLHSPTASLGKLPTAVEVTRMRQELVDLQNSPNAKVAALAKRGLVIFDISTAGPAERHRMIRQLPVQTTQTAPTDGRRGTVKTFYAGGKERSTLFVPAPQPAPKPLAAAEVQHRASGLDDETAEIGRWKQDGNGGCYWDPEDDGPDQCTPFQGRWKDDGNGGCFWAGNDDGPDQCTPPTDACDDGPAPCATEQEVEDFHIFVAYTLAEIDDQVAYLEAEAAAFEEYCNQNPWACDGLRWETAAGPCVEAPRCFNEYAGAVGAAAGATSGILLAAAAAPIKITAVSLMLVFGGVTLAALVVTAGVAVAVNCYLNTSPLGHQIEGLYAYTPTAPSEAVRWSQV